MRRRTPTPTAPIATHLPRIARLSIAVAASATLCAQTRSPVDTQTSQTLTGQAAFTEYSQERPGIRRKLTLADLPERHPTSRSTTAPRWFPVPTASGPSLPWLQGGALPPGISPAAAAHPHRAQWRPLRRRQRRGKDRHGAARKHAGRPRRYHHSTFASGLDHPFGIAFYPLARSCTGSTS